MKLTKYDMELFAIVTLHLRAIWTCFTSIFFITLLTVCNLVTRQETSVATSTRHVSKLARISPTKNVLITNLTSHLNETMTHECISEKFLLLPRHPQQQAASEYLKSFQNSQNKVRDSHDSNRMAQNSMYVNLVSFTLVNKMTFCTWICLILRSRYFNFSIACYFLAGICRKIL